MKGSTKEFENRIEKAGSWDELKEIISDLPKTTFTVRLSELCDKYGMKFSHVQTESGISKSMFYAITNGTRSPKKSHIIQIAFVLGLSLEELNELLKLAKFKELYAKNKEDAILIYGLRNRIAIEDIEEMLIEVRSTIHLIEK